MKRLLTLAILLTAISNHAFADGWGHVKGKFTYDGTAPKAAPLIITKDAQVCGVGKSFSRELVVNPDNNGIENVVVYLYLKRGKTVDVHPSYEETAAKEVVLDNSKCRFEPHILLLRTSQTLVLGNEDAVAHNAKIDSIKNPPANNLIPANSSIKHKFNKAEILPVTVSCSVHPWMNARAVVKDHPYMASSDADGSFEIKNLPAGKHTLQLWHEKSGYVSEAKQDGKSVKWKRGRVEVEVKDGQAVDLGEIKLSKVFKK